MDSPQRLLLHALLSGLGNAVRRNDGSAADRYHRRISQIAGHFDTNPAVSEALERLLSASSQWLETKVAERSEAEQQVLQLMERVTELLCAALFFRGLPAAPPTPKYRKNGNVNPIAKAAAAWTM